MTERQCTNQIIKNCKKYNKNNPNNRVHTVSIKKMCEISGHPEYLDQIRNRLIREMEQNERMGNYIFWDYKNPDDMYLSDDGICIFFEILDGYFSEDDLIALYRLTLDLNNAERLRIGIDKMLEDMTLKQLKDCRQDVGKYLDYPEDSQKIIEKIDKAIQSKTKFKLFMR